MGTKQYDPRHSNELRAGHFRRSVTELTDLANKVINYFLILKINNFTTFRIWEKQGEVVDNRRANGLGFLSGALVPSL